MRTKAWLLYPLFALIGVFQLFHPTILSNFRNTQADPGDPLLVHYFLEHGWQLISNPEYVGSLFSPRFFFPYENALALSENLFAAVPIYSFFRVFLEPSLSFQLWMISISVISFSGFLILMRKLGVRPVWSVLPAFLYAFSMPRAAQISHQQLFFTFFASLAFLCCCKFIANPKTKYLLWGQVFLFLQLLSGIYLGWFLFLICPVFLVTYCILGNHSKSVFKYLKAKKRLITLSIFLLGSSCFGLLLPYFRMRDSISKNYSEVLAMLPRLDSYLFPIQGSLWWSSFGESRVGELPLAHEHHMFMGLGILFFLGMSLSLLLLRCPQKLIRPELTEADFKNRQALAKSSLITFLIIFSLCIYLPTGFSFWEIIYSALPGASSIRAVTRIWTIAYIPLLLGIFLLVDTINFKYVQSLGHKRAFIALSLLSLFFSLSVVEQYSPHLSSFERSSIDDFSIEGSQLIENQCDLAYLYWDVDKNPFQAGEIAQSSFYSLSLQVSGMWMGIRSNIPVINGYSGGVPEGYRPYSEPMDLRELAAYIGPELQGNLCILEAKQDSEPALQSWLSTVGFRQISENEVFNLHHLELPISLPAAQITQEIALTNIDQARISSLKVGEQIQLTAKVKNTSNFPWRLTIIEPTNLGYRWFSPDEIPINRTETLRTLLPRTIYPGESEDITMAVKAPEEAGDYLLDISMVKEGVAWFSDHDSSLSKLRVKVVH